MLHLLALGWFFHPMHGAGYQFWSGIGSDFGEVGTVTLPVAALVWLRHRNCHVHRCWRLSWHPHPVHGHPVCRRHHPDHGRVLHVPHPHLARRRHPDDPPDETSFPSDRRG